MKTPFLIDILKEQLNPEYFKIIKEKYFEIKSIKVYKDQREYKTILKKTILSLKLMKNLVTRLSESNYLDILRSKFVEILEYFAKSLSTISSYFEINAIIFSSTIEDKT